jgi:hypothetical protein
MSKTFQRGVLAAVLGAGAFTLAGCVVEPAPAPYYGEPYYAAPAPVYVGPSFYYGPGYHHWGGGYWHGGGGWHGHR